jgi:hypothetical protein
MAVKKKINIKDITLKNKIMELIQKRKMIMEQKEKEEKNQELLNYKYLPKYLMPKILNAVGFIEYTRQKGSLDMNAMTNFLMKEKKLTKKEMGWVLLLLSFDAVEEILSTPEVGGMIKDAILRNKKTLH